MPPKGLPSVKNSPKVTSGPFEAFARRISEKKAAAAKRKKKPAESATNDSTPPKDEIPEVYDVSDDESEVEVFEYPPAPKFLKKNDDGRGNGPFPAPTPTSDVWLTTRTPLSTRTNTPTSKPVALGKRTSLPVSRSDASPLPTVAKPPIFKEENNDGPSPRGIGSNEVEPHPKWGKLSNNNKDQANRVNLLDWIESVLKDVTRRDDVELERLKKVARWGQNDKEHVEINFTPIGLSQRWNGIRGYYVNTGNQQQKLAAYYAKSMRSSSNANLRKIKAGYNEPDNPQFEKRRQRDAENRPNAPEVEIIYLAGVCRPEVKEPTPWETIQKLEPVPQEDSANGYGLYPGISGGQKRGITSSRDHLSDPSSELYPRIFDPTDPKCLYEIFTRMCDSPATRSTAESFYMEYGDLFNKEHHVERYIYTKAADLPWHLYQKVQTYVTKKVPLFVIVPTGDRSQLPKNKYCTLEDLTTLPIRIGEEEIVLQYDPSDPDLKPAWRRVKDAAALLREFPNPPDSFFYKKDTLKAECETLMKMRN
ncbi:uncharacterized protein LOC110843908 [Folsomia candida]|uniref:uncharacterized protein LOC110843908 n=1 Tax=Folsomia candida TaxID=158441 RepID=UPI001604E142|nr:uncharacterized protein LOC110843908 [Folsomia candida]